MPIIEVDHVTKEFQLGELEGFKTALRNRWRRLLDQPVQHRPQFKALEDVSFSVEPGEVLGIIGHNGAGKSTLLKLLAGISKPTSGRITTHGRIAPLIEVGAGFVAQLTGRENVYLNAAILGISKTEIDRKFDEIVAFSEMEQFIDTPVKRYSSGMRVKLAFAVATSVEAQILIIDEVLAVGDMAFQRKCFDRMEELIRRQGRTVLVVSHNIRQIVRLCSRTLLLDHGRVLQDGNTKEVADHYLELSDQRIASNQHAKSDRQRRQTSGVAEVKAVHLLNRQDEAVDAVVEGEDAIFELGIEIYDDLLDPVFAIGVHTTDMLYLASPRSLGSLRVDHLRPGQYIVRCRVIALPLLPGVYSIRASIAGGLPTVDHYYAENLLHFRVKSNRPDRVDIANEGFFSLSSDWRIRPKCTHITQDTNVTVAPAT